MTGIMRRAATINKKRRGYCDRNAIKKEGDYKVNK
jgi:hypothetical protein